MDVWRSATAMSGGQCVMTYGALLMPMWSADSWDSGKIQVNLFKPLPLNISTVRAIDDFYIGWL